MEAPRLQIYEIVVTDNLSAQPAKEKYILLDFLNENSGAITAITTIVLTGITAVYVYLTRLMLKTTNTPVVRMFLHASEYSVTLCVQNIGTGFARDIKFTGNLSFKPTQPGAAALGDLKPFKDGIDYLGPGHKSETFLFHRAETADLPAHGFDVTVSYKDLANFKGKETFTLKLATGTIPTNLDLHTRTTQQKQ